MRVEPRTQNWNASRESMQQKQWLMRQQAPFTEAVAHAIDSTYEHRLEALLSVDKHVGSIVQLLRERGPRRAAQEIPDLSL